MKLYNKITEAHKNFWNFCKENLKKETNWGELIKIELSSIGLFTIFMLGGLIQPSFLLAYVAGKYFISVEIFRILNED